VRTPPVLLVRSFGNGAGLLVQQRVAGRDLTELDGGRLDEARLSDLWRQVTGLRAARIAHRDLGLGSVMVDEHAKAWLVDFDRAEAAASQPLLDRDVATLLAALDGVADPALVRATAEQALGEEALRRSLPPSAATGREPTRGTSAPGPALDAGPQLEQRDDRLPR
jgi:tRNA A-37 threonylcarbamoyl transferase component Bud32